MNNLESLRDRAQEIRTQLGEYLETARSENRGLTDEEQTSFDTQKGELERIVRTLKSSAEFRSSTEDLDTPATVAEAPALEPEPTEPAEDRGTPVVREVRDREAAQPFGSLGEQLAAVYRSAVPGGATDKRLLHINIESRASGSSEAVPSDGGFLVQKDFAAEILRRTYQIGQVASRVRRIPISANANGLKINAVNESSRVNGSRWGGVQGYWLAEAGLKTGSKPTFRQMELDLKKLIGLWYATDELLQDTTALTAIADQAFAEELNFKVEDAIFNGTGAGQPLGILNGAGKVEVAKETGQLANTIVVENIVKMWARCWARSRMNAAWFVNQDVEPQLYTMGITFGTGGQAVFLPAGNIAGSPFSTLMGRPVIPVEYCATLGTAGDIVLADLSQYLMIDKGAPQAASSIHVRFIYDETTFRFVYRVDGQPTWDQPLTPFKGTNTLAPVVTLATRA